MAHTSKPRAQLSYASIPLIINIMLILFLNLVKHI
jgi:hypothetical protein